MSVPRTHTRSAGVVLFVALLGVGWALWQKRCSSPPPAIDSPPSVMSGESSLGTLVAPPAPTIRASSAESATALSAAVPAASSTPPGDLTQLLSFEGYLWITSAADHGVFVHGVKAGRTNSWLRVPCGLRYVRLGEKPGHWSSEGATVNVACRGATQLAIESGPLTP